MGATPKGRKKAKPRSSPSLPHLTGARALAALWIVCHHVAPREPPSALDPFVTRVDVAVEYFTILSGFLTQLAHGPGSDPADSCGSLVRFYVRRLARVLLTAQAGTALSLLIKLAGGVRVQAWEALGCLLFIKGWAQPVPTCPDLPTWYIDAIVPSWLLYPLIMRPMLMATLKRPAVVLLWLGAALWLAAIGPGLVIMALEGRWLMWKEVVLIWFWPPAQVADFALGALVAAALQHTDLQHKDDGKSAKQQRMFGILADVIVVAFLLPCAMLPLPQVPADWGGPPLWRPGHYVAWEALTARIAAPFLAAFIYLTCKAPSPASSNAVAFLAHPSLVAFGSCTLEVYIFQAPLRELLYWFGPPLAPPFQRLWRGLHWTTEVFISYVFLLWFLSMVFAERVADPMQRRLQTAMSSWSGKPIAWIIQRVRNCTPWQGTRYEELDVEHSTRHEDSGGSGVMIRRGSDGM